MQGPAIQLKKFHNEVKRELIKSFASRAWRLLDLGCGRGGDLHKWIDAGINHVVGVDLSPKEIEEARRRFRELRGKPLAVDFLQSDALGLTSPILFGPAQTPEAFDAVTCVSIGALAPCACLQRMHGCGPMSFSSCLKTHFSHLRVLGMWPLRCGAGVCSRYIISLHLKQR